MSNANPSVNCKPDWRLAKDGRFTIAKNDAAIVVFKRTGRSKAGIPALGFNAAGGAMPPRPSCRLNAVEIQFMDRALGSGPSRVGCSLPATPPGSLWRKTIRLNNLNIKTVSV